MESLDLPDRYAGLDLVVEGGTDDERHALLVAYHTYMVANDHLDFGLLSTVWHAGAEHLFFNTNGHTYEGLADWENIWNFYRPQFELVSPYLPGRLRVGIEGDLAFIASDRVTRFKRWVGGDLKHNPAAYRSTLVLRRGDDGWRVVHAHFSTEDEGLRPDRDPAGAPA
ncbi:nuclear transport factor 2 family protein [Nocardioides sp. WV_118_6]|uniref:nuclear transport factor 2 family protein n=1 Tax=Pimelobacter TaxID=2044 RepID=UPI001C0547DE|nr:MULTISPECIES: nuclear transport factor 2 family protein [Pimelobacter]UUW90115.1 nuclear transport factor 2 family protein [Pimelobacter simplex]UUW93944.1 nuclear transport factor 2 family protein [Pimelobacter simplex]